MSRTAHGAALIQLAQFGIAENRVHEGGTE
jgi:hypothetical protein